MSSKESSGKTCTHADPRLLEGFQAKQSHWLVVHIAGGRELSRWRAGIQAFTDYQHPDLGS